VSWEVDFVPEEVELDRCLIAKINMGWLWHWRLAHVGMRNLHKLQKDGHILGAHHHVKNIMTTTIPLAMLHMNLFDLVAYISVGGNKYGLIIVDNYSRFTWIFFLQDKSKTQEMLKKFLKRAQNEFDNKVKKIRSDNDTEFKNT
jgi:hypothetical protein